MNKANNQVFKFVHTEITDDVVGSSIKQLITNLKGHLDNIPEECQDDAYIDVSYGEEYLAIAIEYRRPETDEEKKRRLEDEKRWKQQRLNTLRKQIEALSSEEKKQVGVYYGK